MRIRLSSVHWLLIVIFGVIHHASGARRIPPPEFEGVTKVAVPPAKKSASSVSELKSEEKPESPSEIPAAPPLEVADASAKIPVKKAASVPVAPRADVVDALYNRLVILLDDTNMELTSEDTNYIAMTLDFAATLCEKTTPMLLSTSLVKNFLRYANDPKNKKVIADFKKHTDLGHKPEAFSMKSGPKFTLIKPQATEWLMYVHNKEPLLVLIPRAYAKKQEAKFNKLFAKKKEDLVKLEALIKEKYLHEELKLEEKGETKESVAEQQKNYQEERTYFKKELATLSVLIKSLEARFARLRTRDDRLLLCCGFNPDYLTKQVIRSFNELAKLPESMIEKAEASRVAIQECLLPKEELLGLWLIDLGGHGGSFEIPKSPDEIKKIKEDIKSYTDSIAKHELDIKNAQEKQKEAQKKPLFERSRYYRKIVKNIRETTEKLVDDKANLVWLEDQLKSPIKASSFSDLTFPVFEKLLHYFNGCTAFLLNWTCFSGGINQKFLQETLSKLHVSFYMAMVGVADTSVYSDIDLTINVSGIGSVQILQIKSVGSKKNFFDRLEAFLRGKSMGISRKGLASAIKNPWADIFAQINIKQWFIRYPGIEKVFAPDQLMSKNILTLSVVAEKAYELTNREIHAEDKSLVLVHPQRVAVPLYIGEGTEIACLSTPEISKNFAVDTSEYVQYLKGKQHYFMQIMYPFNFLFFIPNILNYFGPHPTTIFIKKIKFENTLSHAEMIGEVAPSLPEVGDPLFRKKMDAYYAYYEKMRQFKNIIVSGTIPGEVSIRFYLGEQTYEWKKRLEENPTSFKDEKFTKSADDVTDEKFNEMIKDIPRNLSPRPMEEFYKIELEKNSKGLTESIYKNFTDKLEQAKKEKEISLQGYEVFNDLAKKLREKYRAIYEENQKKMEAILKEPNFDKKIEAMKKLATDYPDLKAHVEATLFETLKIAHDAKLISEEEFKKYIKPAWELQYLIMKIRKMPNAVSMIFQREARDFGDISKRIEIHYRMLDDFDENVKRIRELTYATLTEIEIAEIRNKIIVIVYDFFIREINRSSSFFLDKSMRPAIRIWYVSKILGKEKIKEFNNAIEQRLKELESSQDPGELGYRAIKLREKQTIEAEKYRTELANFEKDPEAFTESAYNEFTRKIRAVRGKSISESVYFKLHGLAGKFLEENMRAELAKFEKNPESFTESAYREFGYKVTRALTDNAISRETDIALKDQASKLHEKNKDLLPR